MSVLIWRFSAFDSLFFRESRPFDTIGGSELSSIFPPSPATIAGAIRSAVGDYQPGGVVWANYPKAYPDLQQKMGDSESLGQMSIKGIFLSRQNPVTGEWERLYPVPADLVASKSKAEKGVAIKNIKPLDGYWLTQTDLAKVLSGKEPDIKDLIPSSALYSLESR